MIPIEMSDVAEGELACQMTIQIKGVKSSHVPIQVDINMVTISKVTNKR